MWPLAFLDINNCYASRQMHCCERYASFEAYPLKNSKEISRAARVAPQRCPILCVSKALLLYLKYGILYPKSQVCIFMCPVAWEQHFIGEGFKFVVRKGDVRTSSFCCPFGNQSDKPSFRLRSCHRTSGGARHTATGRYEAGYVHN